MNDESVDSDPIDVQSEQKLRCGWLWYTPDFLQSFRTSGWALTFISCAAFSQCAIVNGILHLMIPTIERRFNLSSFKSGIISGGYDIASLLCLIPITYIGGRPNACKPTWIGLGIIIMAIGALIFASPYFLANNYYHASIRGQSHSLNLCNSKNDSHHNCPDGKDTKLSSFMWLFLIGNLFHGGGASPLYTLGITYLHESVVEKKAGIFMGTYYAFATLGAAFGYVFGGYLLQLNENFLSDSIHVVSVNNKNWIGAWWLGFIVLGMFSLVISFPILALPAKLPDWQKVRASKVSEAVIGNNRTRAYSTLKELPSAMKELLSNTSFIFLNFAGCCEGIIFSGSGAFIPKIIQTQFHLTSKTTALVMGIITVPSAIIGTMVGGGILKRFNLRFVGILKLCIGTTTMSLLCTSCFLIVCEKDKLVGVNVPYFVDRKQILLEDPCNEMCDCSKKDYLPVCGVNNYTYYSPCFAGCRQAHNSSQSDVKLYFNCSCIEEQSETGMQASGQPCTLTCAMLPLFLILMYLSLFFTFVAAMPALTATLRCVKSDQRSLALGMQWMLVRLLGMIPGPMLFGAIVDGACEFWHAPCTDEESSCVSYDRYAISRSMAALSFCWKSLEIILFSLSIYFFKREQN